MKNRPYEDHEKWYKKQKLMPAISPAIQIAKQGRVHSANITGINHQKGVVMVEWVENAATKGKEVDFGELIRLNADLFEYMNSLDQTEVLPLKENVDIQVSPANASMHLFFTMSWSSCSVYCHFSQRSYSLRRSVQTKPAALQQVCETEEESLPPALAKVSFPNGSARRKSTVVQQMEKMKSKRETDKAKNTEMRAKRAKECDVKWEFQKMIEDFRDSLEYTPLSFSDPSEDHRICVCVRKRPLNKKEIAKKEIDVITIPEKGLLLVHEPKQKVDLTKYLDNQTFRFDYSFDDSATNEMVYRFTARPLVQKIFEGSMATCFAYGQTGSGKTHVFDLLNKKAKLRVLEDSKQQVQVVGLQERQVASADDVIKVIDIGSACSLAQEEPETHVCPHCSREFTYVGSLNKHVAVSCPLKPASSKKAKKGSSSGGGHSFQDKNGNLRRRTADSEIKLQGSQAKLGKTRARSSGPSSNMASPSKTQPSKLKTTAPQIRQKRLSSFHSSSVPDSKKSKTSPKGSPQQHPSPPAALGNGSQKLVMRMQKKVTEAKAQQQPQQQLQLKKEERFSVKMRERSGGPVTRSLQLASSTAPSDVKGEDVNANQESREPQVRSKSCSGTGRQC
ncbi:UNVERIFIED_CONTAM: hypothetical protein FKN15_006280 [Acipenser sinensis]